MEGNEHEPDGEPSMASPPSSPAGRAKRQTRGVSIRSWAQSDRTFATNEMVKCFFDGVWYKARVTQYNNSKSSYTVYFPKDNKHARDIDESDLRRVSNWQDRLLSNN